MADAQSFGTAFGSIYDREPLLHLDVEDDEAFIGLLRELHTRRLPSKEANFLVSPAHFETAVDGTHTARGLQNVRYVRGIWLDNDGGDLRHGEFARLFPAVRMVVWNTYSSTREMPRWRCFIPTKQVVSAAAYKAIIEQIMQVLRNAGYVPDTEKTKKPDLKTHGFDTGKFVASSLFYAPCQAADPKASFFTDYNEDGRMAIDPELWIENDIRQIKLSAAEIDHSEVSAISGDKTKAIQLATERWRGSPRGQGNRAFYRFAQDLKRAGLTKTEIRTRLEMEATHAASPRDREADARRFCRS